jgi:hypothetical protein
MLSRNRRRMHDHAAAPLRFLGLDFHIVSGLKY